MPQKITNRILSADFSTWTVEDARSVVSARKPASYDENRLYHEGDHWQGNKGWVGPHPTPEETGAEETWAELRRGFVSQNSVAEINERHADGVVGTEPAWALAPRRALKQGEEPTPEEETARNAVEEVFTPWWDERQVHEMLRTSVITLCYARRAVLRLRVPGAVDGAGSVPTPATLEDALDMIHVDLLTPDEATVYTDPATRRTAGVYIYKSTDGADVVELTYLDDAGNTVLRVLSGATAAQGDAPVPMPLGRALTMHLMERTPLITPQVLQLQRNLNLAISTIPRSVITAGWLERVLLNAQLPGTWERDAAGARLRFIPDPLRVGAGTTQAYTGVDAERPDGTVSIANPDVKWRPAQSPTPSIEASEALYQWILRAAKQVHILSNASGNITGRSREQARADFGKSLQPTGAVVNAAGRWLLDTVLHLAEYLMGTPGAYTRLLRASFAVTLDTGPLSPEERAQNVAEAKDNLRSYAGAMSANGIADVDAEIRAIRAQPGAELELLERRAAAAVVLTSAGYSVQEADALVGINSNPTGATDEDALGDEDIMPPGPEQRRRDGGEDDDPNREDEG